MPLNASVDLYFALTQNELAKNKKNYIENNYYAFVINNTGVEVLSAGHFSLAMVI